MAAEAQEGGGTLVRGADGALYYIPDDKLEAFALPDDQAEEARELIGHERDIVTLSVARGPAVRRSGLAFSNTDTVSVVNVAAIRQSG
jgi:hypothetical protein